MLIDSIIQGCVDEHPSCEDWAGSGECVQNPKFMTHTCRESCGVCGFLSSTNKEEQVVSKKSYTDIRSIDFECGKYKTLSEIEKGPASSDTDAADDDSKDQERSKRQTKEEEEDSTEDFSIFSYNRDIASSGEYFCGATIISDRYQHLIVQCS